MTKGEIADQRKCGQFCCPIYRTLGSKGLSDASEKKSFQSSGQEIVRRGTLKANFHCFQLGLLHSVMLTFA